MKLEVYLIFTILLLYPWISSSIALDNQPSLQQKNQQAVDSSADIHDIYGPVMLPEPFNWIPYMLAFVLILIAGGCFFFYFRKQKQIPEPAIAPHETALAELVQARKYIESDQSLQYSQRVSEILRVYIERRFNIHMTRQTTHEFLSLAQREETGLLHHHRESLQRCLEQCDMAKYARKTVARTGLEEMESKVHQFIQETMEDKEG